MKVRFQADANLDARIVRGLKRRQPDIDFRSAEEARLRGLADQEVLGLSAAANRILVTHDRRTMPGHFEQFITGQESTGVIVIAKDVSIGAAVDELLLVWAATEAEEWRNRLVWIPL